MDCQEEPVAPESTDVLCGSGGEIHKHPGNIRFAAIIKKHYHGSGYAAAKTKSEKMKVTKLIFDEIVQTGGRLLKKDSIYDQTWFVAGGGGNKVVRDKISHHIRRLGKDEARREKSRRRGKLHDQLSSDDSCLVCNSDNDELDRVIVASLLPPNDYDKQGGESDSWEAILELPPANRGKEGCYEPVAVFR